MSRTLVGHALAMLEAEGRITREGEHAIRAMEVHLLRVEGNLLDAGASRTRT